MMAAIPEIKLESEEGACSAAASVELAGAVFGAFCAACFRFIVA